MSEHAEVIGMNRAQLSPTSCAFGLDFPNCCLCRQSGSLPSQAADATPGRREWLGTSGWA
jgi:hypothetical protein